MSASSTPAIESPAPAAWSEELLAHELAQTSDPGDRCRIMLCWDTALAADKLADVTLEGLLVQAANWGHSPAVRIGDQEYAISQRTIRAIADWLIADRAPETAKRTEQDAALLDRPGYVLAALDDGGHEIASRGPLTLREVAEQFESWTLAEYCTWSIVPPADDDEEGVAHV